MTKKIDEFIFNPNCSEDTLKAAKQWLIDNTRFFHSTANFAIFKDGEKIEDRQGAPCHSSSPQAEGMDCLATEISNRSPVESKVQEPFLKWFLEDSVFSRFILNSNDFEFCRNYGIIVSTDTPQPLFQAILIISRHFQECNKASFEKFNELTQEKGVPCEIAYPFCFNTFFSTSGTKDNSVVVMKENHRAFPLFTVKAFKRFLARETFVPLEKSWREEASLRGPYTLFLDGKESAALGKFRGFSATDAPSIITDLMEDENFKKEFSKYRKKNSEATIYSPPNPFTPPKPVSKTPPTNPAQVSYIELFEFIVPYIVKEKVI